MKNESRKITALLMVMVLGLSLFATACSKKDDADDAPEPTETNVYVSLDLPSDSDNGVEWTFEQDKELFSCEDTFLVDEGSETGSGELQSFELSPKASGTAILTFKCESKETTYTYEVEVAEDGSVSVKSSSGLSGETEVDAPQLVIEKN